MKHARLAVVEPVRELISFDLEKALNGAPLVTRDGKPATAFRLMRPQFFANYPYDALIGGKNYCFTPTGTYWINSLDAMDLFMAEASR